MTKQNWTSDPVIESISLTSDGMITGDRTEVKNRSISLGISATDKNSNIEKVCVKYNVDPSLGVSANDSCWVNLIDHDQITFNTSDFNFNLGFVAGDYDLYVWVMDDDGSVSENPTELNALKLNYNPGKPPEVFSVTASNKNIPDSNPQGILTLSEMMKIEKFT